MKDEEIEQLRMATRLSLVTRGLNAKANDEIAHNTVETSPSRCHSFESRYTTTSTMLTCNNSSVEKRNEKKQTRTKTMWRTKKPLAFFLR